MTHINIKILFALALLFSSLVSPTMAMDSEPEDAQPKHSPTLQELEAQLQKINAQQRAVAGCLQKKNEFLLDPTGTEIQDKAQ